SALLIFGSTLTLLGPIGFLHFQTFYERLHAPTLGAPLGLFSILAAPMIYFSVAQTRAVIHDILVGVFVTVTPPVMFLLLTQATLYRDRFEARDPLAGLNEETNRIKTPPES